MPVLVIDNELEFAQHLEYYRDYYTTVSKSVSLCVYAEYAIVLCVFILIEIPNSIPIVHILLPLPMLMPSIPKP